MSKHSEPLQKERKKNFSNNNNMYRTKPFGISCTLHSVQRRSTNRDTALSHTTTSAWFVFEHVSHSSEEAWGKETQHVRDNVRQTIKKKFNFSKLQKKKFSKTPIFQPQKGSTSMVYHQPAPTHQCHQRRPVLHHVCPHHVPGQQVFQKRRFCFSPDLRFFFFFTGRQEVELVAGVKPEKQVKSKKR